MSPSDLTGLFLISLASATPLANRIGYAGYVFLPDFGTLGHWLARHRIFDPEMGRWITRDPAGYVDGMSLYLYARGNPWMFVDPMGLYGIGQWWSDVREGASIIGQGVAKGASAVGEAATKVARHVFMGDGSSNLSSSVSQSVAEKRQLMQDLAGDFKNPSLIGGSTHEAMSRDGFRVVAEEAKSHVVSGAVTGSLSTVVGAGIVVRAAGEAVETGVKTATQSTTWTTRNYRQGLEQRLGRELGSNEQAHHLLTNPMMKEINKRFGDVNRNLPEHLVPVAAPRHQRWSGQYNQRMMDFIRNNPNATLDDILNEGRRLTQELESVCQ